MLRNPFMITVSYTVINFALILKRYLIKKTLNENADDTKIKRSIIESSIN